MSYFYVSGSLTPDATGRYEEAGTYGSKPYYSNGSYVIFWENSLTIWVIHDTIDPVGPYYWIKSNDPITGTYTPVLGSGTATVAAITPEVFRGISENQLELSNVVDLQFTPDQIHQDWVRWCYASINKHFDDRKSNYELYIEGDVRTQQDEAEFAELRIDGPFILIPQKNLYILDVEINVLCQTHLDPRRHYKAQVMVGTFAKAFENLINVHRYGDGPFDDNSLLECFHLNRDLREKVAINYFGIVRPDTKITQTTIEGHYRLELWS